MLEILCCIFVTNLSKIGLLMFPWQQILESALKWDQPIQLSNDITVTLFLNQSSQNFELRFEMIISTSVQIFSRIQCFILPWQHILWRVLRDKLGPQNQWWSHCDVISQSISTKFCIFVCYTNKHLCAKFEQSRTRNKEFAKNGKWCHCHVISTNSSAIFCVWVFVTHTYWCTKFQVAWRSDKGITGGGTKHPPRGLRMTKKARAG